MTVKKLRQIAVAFASASLLGSLLIGIPAAVAGTGKNCDVNTPASKAQCDLIKVALVNKVVTLDPGSSVRTTNQNYVTKDLVQGKLFRIGVDGLPKKDLISDFKVSEDGKTWTLTLKKGLKYSDNTTPVKADDAVFAFEYLKSSTAGIPPGFGVVESVTAPDDSTIVYKLKQRFDDFSYFLAGLFYHLNPRSKAAGNPDYWKNPLSAGPFKIRSWTAGDDIFSIEANPNYWAKVAVKRVDFVAIPDPVTRVIALRQGTIDYAFDLPGAIARGQLNDKKKYRFTPTQAQGTFTLDFNLRATTPGGAKAGSPLSNVKVRQALSYAINRKQMGQVAFFGDVAPGCSITWANSPLATCAIPTRTRQDLSRARALLKEAGYENGIDPATKAAITFNLTVFNRPGWADAASLIAADWAKVGVRATVIPQLDSVGSAAQTSGDFNVQLSGATGQIPTLILRTYYGKTGAWTVWAGSSSDDAALDAIDAAPAAEKKALIAAVEKKLWDEAAHIPLGQRFWFGVTTLPAGVFTNIKGNDTYVVKSTPPLS